MEKQNNIPENSNKQCPGVDDANAGKQDGCKGCPNQDLCKTGKAKEMMQEAQADFRQKLSSIKHKILVLSGKGGVGKSTVSTQLALQLSKKGYEVGLLDIDLCGPSIPKMLNLQNSEVHSSNDGWSPVYVNDNLGVMSIGFLLNNQDDAVIWRGPRKTGLIKQFILDVDWGNLDFLVIDTPPGTSDEHISIVQFLNMGQDDGALIVTTPQEVSLIDVRKEVSFCQKSKINVVGVIENMSYFQCPNCQCQTKIFESSNPNNSVSSMCDQFGLDIIGKIPINVQIMKDAENGDQNKSNEFTAICEQIEKIFIE